MKWRDFGLGLGVGLILLTILASSFVANQPKEVTMTQTVTQKTTVTYKTTISESVTITKPISTTLTRTITATTTKTITTTPKTTTTTTTTQTIPEYELGEAIKSGYVEAKISGRCNPMFGCGGLLGGGISSGDSIYIQFKSLVDYTIKIFVVEGQFLLAEGDAQNMVIKEVRGIPLSGGFSFMPRSQIVLSPSQAQAYLFSAYCVNFYKPNPTNATVFSLSGLAAPDVISVLEVIDKLSSNVTSVAAIQVAIFVITDDVSKDELDKRFPVKAEDITNAKTILEAAGIDISQKRLFT